MFIFAEHHFIAFFHKFIVSLSNHSRILKLCIWHLFLTYVLTIIFANSIEIFNSFFYFNRNGLSIEAACGSVSKELLDVFNFALVWGRSTKFNPQRVGLSHVLMDEDVFQVVPKTLVQQKQSKDYRQKVDSYNAAIAKERSRKRKIKT